MKYLFLVIITLSTSGIFAQSVVQGTLASTGATINDSESGIQLNFTLGQPFGEGEMVEDGDIVVVQGLQGAGASVSESPEPSGIIDYSNLDAQLVFDAATGEILLQGNGLDEISGIVLISDLNGKVLSSSKITSGAVQQNGIRLAAKNIYLLTVITDDNQRLSKKLIF